MSADASRPVDDKDIVCAAGGLVTREGPGGVVEVLAVHRPRYDDWSLPKGKLAAGETAERAAVREVEEETGVRAAVLTELAPSRYVDRHGRPKEVRWYLMTVEAEGRFTPDLEVDEVRWLTLADAARVLTYAHDRRLVEEHATP